MEAFPDANYLLKSLQGFQNKGIPVYAISIQVCSFALEITDNNSWLSP